MRRLICTLVSCFLLVLSGCSGGSGPPYPPALAGDFNSLQGTWDRSPKAQPGNDILPGVKLTFTGDLLRIEEYYRPLLDRDPQSEEQTFRLEVSNVPRKQIDDSAVIRLKDGQLILYRIEGGRLIHSQRNRAAKFVGEWERAKAK
jgi:hypothetical protein